MNKGQGILLKFSDTESSKKKPLLKHDTIKQMMYVLSINNNNDQEMNTLYIISHFKISKYVTWTQLPLKMTSLDVNNEWFNLDALSLCGIRTYINKKYFHVYCVQVLFFFLAFYFHVSWTVVLT